MEETALNCLIEELKKQNTMQRILLAIDSGACPALVTGAGSIHKAHMASAIFEYTKRPMLLVCADEQETRRLSLDVETLTGQPVWRLAGRDFVFHNVETASRQAEQLRLRTLYAMASGQSQIVVATVEAVLQRTLPKDRLLRAARILKSGESYPPEEIVASLTTAGYKRCDQVEGVGQFALRGGILDFFSPAEDNPVRCEFFGDEIDSMGVFDVLTQRRTEMIESTVILPAAETNLGFFPGGETAFLERLESLRKKVAARKNAPAAAQEKIREDLERLKAGRELPAADKYLDLLYPPVSAVDFLPRTPSSFSVNRGGWRSRQRPAYGARERMRRHCWRREHSSAARRTSTGPGRKSRTRCRSTRS